MACRGAEAQGKKLGTRLVPSCSSKKTQLAGLGISKPLASKLERIASIPEDAFDSMIAAARTGDAEVSRAALLTAGGRKAGQRGKPQPGGCLSVEGRGPTGVRGGRGASAPLRPGWGKRQFCRLLTRIEDAPKLLAEACAFEVYAARIAGEEGLRAAQVFRARVDRRVGQLVAALEKLSRQEVMAKAREAKDNGASLAPLKTSKKSQVEAAGLSVRLASKLERIASIPDDAFLLVQVGAADRRFCVVCA